MSTVWIEFRRGQPYDARHPCVIANSRPLLDSVLSVAQAGRIRPRCMNWDCPAWGEEGSVGESRRTGAVGKGRTALVTAFGILGLLTSAAAATPAAAPSDIGVWVAFAGRVRAEAAHFP